MVLLSALNGNLNVLKGRERKREMIEGSGSDDDGDRVC